MTPEELQQVLVAGLSPERLRELRAALERWGPGEAFRSLWPLALNTDLVPADQWASYLLVELDPPCPLRCEDALREIARSELNLSNRLVPFYLAAQFGKHKVLKKVREVSAGEFAAGVPETLSGIAYWLDIPAVELVRGFVEWRRKGQ